MKLRSFLFTCALVLPTTAAFADNTVQDAALALGELLGNGASTLSVPEGQPLDMALAYFVDRHGEDPETIVEDAGAFNMDANELGLFSPKDDPVDAIMAEIAYCTDNDIVASGEP